jgi:hypothetical protein
MEQTNGAALRIFHNRNFETNGILLYISFNPSLLRCNLITSFNNQSPNIYSLLFIYILPSSFTREGMTTCCTVLYCMYCEGCTVLYCAVKVMIVIRIKKKTLVVGLIEDHDKKKKKKL